MVFELLSNVFGTFFEYIILYIFTPIIILFGLAFFFGIQYIFIKLYIYLFNGGEKALIWALEFVKSYEFKILSKILNTK